VATLNSNSQDIPNEWELDYAPLPIDDNIYNGQLSKIILDELNEILSECPNNKAAGVSNITYELIKLSSKHYKLWLIKLFNACLISGTTPTNWKYTLLYPISKPMEWECDINKTQPIVLLKIIRKIFSKIIT